MKIKVIISIIAVVAIIVAVAGYAIYSQVNETQELEFILIHETGNVSYKKPGSNDYSKLETVELTIPEGSFIKTEADSYARVLLWDNSLVSIDQNTEIQVKLENDNASIKQSIGRTWHRVQTLLKGDEYQVETPNTIAAVRGTIFGVDVDRENLSRVFVVENGVEVSRFEIKDDAINVLETLDVNTDEIAQIIKDEKSFRIEKGKIPQEFKESFWYKRNKIIDEQYLKIRDRKGRDFLKLLNQALLQNPEYTTFRFGLTPADQLKQENIDEQLQQVSDITKINEQTCQNFSQSDLQLGLDKVNIYRDYISNFKEINDLLNTLKQSCVDGNLDLAEIEDIRKKVEEANNAV